MIKLLFLAIVAALLKGCIDGLREAFNRRFHDSEPKYGW